MEYIGFIISLLALAYLFFKQQSFVKGQPKHPHETEDESTEEDELEEWIHSKKKELPPKKVPPPREIKQKESCPPSLQGDYRLKSEIEKRQLKSALGERHLKPKRGERIETVPLSKKVQYSHHLVEESPVIGVSRASKILSQLSSRRNLIVYQEIISKPKSMRLE